MTAANAAAARSAIGVNSSVSGITASTTQTQGQQPLTAAFNYVDTVANRDDVVTLASLVDGVEQFVDNGGANRLQLFPAVGQDVGGIGGTNQPVFLEPGEAAVFKYKTANVGALYRTRDELTPVELTTGTTLTSGQMYGTHFAHTTALQTIVLPAAKAGMNFSGEVEVAAVVKLDPDASEVIKLNGTALTGGFTIDSDGTVNCNYVASCRVDGTWSIRANGFVAGA